MEIHYITYQTFPAETGNSLQSVSNIIEMVRMNNKVTLTFPNRDSKSSDSLDDLQSYYNFKEKFKVNRVLHPLPFGRFNNFNKFNFHISHFLWSLFVTGLNPRLKKVDLFITRSDWVFFFLSKRRKKVIFECHGESKLRKLLLKNSLKNKDSKVIFLTESLKKHYKSTGYKQNQNIVLGSGYRNELFNKEYKKITKQVVFVGNLLRFGKGRGLEVLLESFTDTRLSKYNLIIVGGPEEYVLELQKKIKELGVDNIQLTGRLEHGKTIEIIQKSEIGILTNSSENINSTMHTSPLKYFDYIASSLKVVAVDFESHRSLPFSENMLFFEEESKESFIKALLKAADQTTVSSSSYETYSYKNRVRKIFNFARLEGFEPPTL